MILINPVIAYVTLPTWVVVAQWILLFTLGGLVIVLYRQFAYVLSLRDVGTERDGLPIGEKAPAFDLLPFESGRDAPVRFDPVGHWSLLMFADSGCESCSHAVTALGRLAPKLRQLSQVLVVTQSEPLRIAAVEAFAIALVPVGRVDAEVSERLYRTHVTPFAYEIDPEGIIRAKGAAGDEPGIRRIMNKADRNAINVVPTT